MLNSAFRRNLWSVPVAAAALVVTSLVTGSTAGAQTPGPSVVVSGLNNPRELAMTRNGELLIAEAGYGGTIKIGSGRGAEFVGETGSVSMVPDPSTGTNESPNRILGGFLSAASASGIGATGSDGVGARARNSIYVAETFAPVSLPPFVPDQLGRLFVGKAHGLPSEVANVSAYNQAANPDGQPFDSNPYAVLVTSPTTELVADAAANDIVQIANGAPSTFHVFPNLTTGRCARKHDPTPSFPGCNFVPTSLAQDHRGDIFVTGLASEVPGAGEVVELDPSGATVLQTWTGFTAPDGVAVSRDGTVFVSQLEAPEAAPPSAQIVGVVTTISPSGVQANTDVPFPGGLVLDRSGNLYVSAFSIAPATGLMGPATSGEVLRIPEGASFSAS
jgi:hypothetical protein